MSTTEIAIFVYLAALVISAFAVDDYQKTRASVFILIVGPVCAVLVPIVCLFIMPAILQNIWSKFSAKYAGTR